MFVIDPNGMFRDPLWKMIEACTEEPPPGKNK